MYRVASDVFSGLPESFCRASCFRGMSSSSLSDSCLDVSLPKMIRVT